MHNISFFEKILGAALAMFLLSFSTVYAQAISYSYDNLHRLTSVTYGNGASIAYTYDATGNRTLLQIIIPDVIGDANGDGVVDLTDAILSLQVMTGVAAPAVTSAKGDVNADGKMGMAEAIHALEKATNP